MDVLRLDAARLDRRAAGIARGWWVFLVLPQIGLGALFLYLPFVRGSPYYLGETRSDPYGYGWLFVLACIPYGLGLWGIARSGRSPSRRALWIGIAAAVVPLTLAPLAQSRDAMAYLFYAKMQLSHGANPYITTPSAFAGDPWFRFTDWPGAVSVYGPLWTRLVAGLVAATGRRLVAGLLAIKVLGSVCTVAAVAGLLALRSDPAAGVDPRGTFAAVAFAFCPLVLATGPLSGHPDALLAAGFAWAMVLDQRGRPSAAGLLLAMAVLVKAYAAVPLLVYGYVLWRRRRLRPLGVVIVGGAALTALAYAPYWAGWATLKGTLSTGLHSSSGLAGTVELWLASGIRWMGSTDATSIAATIIRVIAGVAFLSVTVLLARSERTLREPWWAAAVLFATLLLVTPWFLPWYVVGLLAIVAPLTDGSVSTPLFLFSGTSLIQLPGLDYLGRTFLRYGPPLLAWQRGGIRARWTPRRRR